MVVVGNKLDPAAFEPLPKNVILVANDPQLELLKRASLCVTHAGLNTVFEALSEGVPLVALPVTHDQPGAAARIRHKRVGDFLEVSDCSAESLSNLIATVLSDSDYRENAKLLAKAITQAEGLSRAATKIEQALSPARDREPKRNVAGPLGS